VGLTGTLRLPGTTSLALYSRIGQAASLGRQPYERPTVRSPMGITRSLCFSLADRGPIECLRALATWWRANPTSQTGRVSQTAV
jgi:hypothetical protein